LAKNEDGEFELILGNRQLISVFLIVVVLLGVFFSMGYIVGRNSGPAIAEVTHDTTRPAKSRTAPADVAPDTPKPTDTPAPESEATPHDRSAAGTHVAQDVPEKPAATPPPAIPDKSKPSPTRQAATPPPAPASVTGDPAPGDYWQVVATARPDAEIITEALSKKGFHALMAPAPKEGVFRVLVGPLKDAGIQAQTRTALEAAGFKNPIVRKY
jgi:cell division septation protein DedD